MDQTQSVTSVGSNIWEVGDVVVNKLHFIHFHFIAMHFLNFSDTRPKCISGLDFLHLLDPVTVSLNDDFDSLLPFIALKCPDCGGRGQGELVLHE